MPYLIYTIGGKPVTGKSTLAKTLAQELGYDRIYVGGILREWSLQSEHNPQNLPFDEWYRSLHNNSRLDNKADRTVGEAAQLRNNLVLEGRVPLCPTRKKRDYLQRLSYLRPARSRRENS